MEITVEQKLKLFSNKELIQLTNELKQTSVPDNALLREVIKDTELDTTAPILAFVGVGQMLAHVLADRLLVAESEKNKHMEVCRVLNDRLQDAIDMG